MSVLVRGMEMPEWCFECPLALPPENDDDHYWTCGGNGMRVHKVSAEERRPYNCPLEDVTEEVRHGDSQLPVNENRSLCKLRHENGNCLCVGGFCTAVNDEICKAIRMSYEKGYVDGKMDGAEK